MKLVDTHDHILSAFDRQIAGYATKHFRRSGIELVLNCRVRFLLAVPLLLSLHERETSLIGSGGGRGRQGLLGIKGRGISPFRTSHETFITLASFF